MAIEDTLSTIKQRCGTVGLVLIIVGLPLCGVGGYMSSHNRSLISEYDHARNRSDFENRILPDVNTSSIETLREGWRNAGDAADKVSRAYIELQNSSYSPTLIYLLFGVGSFALLFGFVLTVVGWIIPENSAKQGTVTQSWKIQLKWKQIPPGYIRRGLLLSSLGLVPFALFMPRLLFSFPFFFPFPSFFLPWMMPWTIFLPFCIVGSSRLVQKKFPNWHGIGSMKPNTLLLCLFLSAAVVNYIVVQLLYFTEPTYNYYNEQMVLMDGMPILYWIIAWIHLFYQCLVYLPSVILFLYGFFCVACNPYSFIAHFSSAQQPHVEHTPDSHISFMLWGYGLCVLAGLFDYLFSSFPYATLGRAYGWMSDHLIVFFPLVIIFIQLIRYFIAILPIAMVNHEPPSTPRE